MLGTALLLAPVLAAGVDVDQGAGARRLAQFVLPVTHQAWAEDGTSVVAADTTSAVAADDSNFQMADSVVYTISGVTYPAGTYEALDESTLPKHFTTEQQRIQFHTQSDSSAAAASSGVATTMSTAVKQAQSALTSGLNKVMSALSMGGSSNSSQASAIGQNPHTEAVQSSPAPVALYNLYQSSSKDAINNPASAAADGNPDTASLTDFESCSNLLDKSKYNECGLLGACLDAPAYDNAHFVSTRANPFLYGEFSADMSATYQVTQVQLVNRQDCCRCPLAGANIYIGNPASIDLALADNPDFSTDSNWALCATVPDYVAGNLAPIFSPGFSYTQTFQCQQSLTGQAVLIQLPGLTRILSIAEIVVYGEQTA